MSMNSSVINAVHVDGVMPPVSTFSYYQVMNYRLVLTGLQAIPFYIAKSKNHRDPATGLTPTVLFSSAGNPFKTTNGLINEVGNGWYDIIPTPEDILGVAPLILTVPAHDDPDIENRTDACTTRTEILPASGVAPLRVGMARYPLTFYMRSSVDHASPAIGLTPTVLISKAGGPFLAPVGLIVEIGYGWYMCLPDISDVDTVGSIILKAMADTADDTVELYYVTGSILDNQLDRYTLALLMIRTMLINSGLFTEASCVISLDKEPFPTPSIPSVWINPGRTGFDPELEAGGTRYTLLTSPVFTLSIIVRRMQDVEVHDQNWITNVKRGAYPIIWKVVNVLAGKFIYSVAGDLLTTRSIRPLGIGEPYRYRGDPMMSVVPITFTTDVQIDVDMPYPYIPQS